MSGADGTGEVMIVRTGTANVASVIAGLERLGVTARLTSEADDVRSARALVLPGVGAFGATMNELRQSGLVEALRARIELGRATLAVCLGLQLFAEASDESPGVPGLGIIGCVVRRFDGAVRIPQMGWNGVKPDAGCEVVHPGFAYYANSYALRIDAQDPAGSAGPLGWSMAWSNHGGRFVAAMERGAVVGCQFHPELSGAWGLALMERWLERAGIAAAAGTCRGGAAC